MFSKTLAAKASYNEAGWGGQGSTPWLPHIPHDTRKACAPRLAGGEGCNVEKTKKSPTEHLVVGASFSVSGAKVGTRLSSVSSKVLAQSRCLISGC